MPKFILKINLGNEGMQNGTDISLKLGEISKEIYHYGLAKRQIHDINGNTVGYYEVTE